MLVLRGIKAVTESIYATRTPPPVDEHGRVSLEERRSARSGCCGARVDIPPRPWFPLCVQCNGTLNYSYEVFPGRHVPGHNERCLMKVRTRDSMIEPVANNVGREVMWRRYGLSLSPEMSEREPEYAEMVTHIHDAVCDWLEHHGGDKNAYLRKQPGYMYFDIAKKAVGDEYLDLATKKAQAISERVRERVISPIHGEALFEGEFTMDFSGFKPGTYCPAPEDVSCKDSRAAHCWHTSPIQHAMMYHRDDICCHCGHARCVSLGLPVIPEGHGPYFPR